MAVPKPDKSTPLLEADPKSCGQAWFDFFGYVDAQIKSFIASIVSLTATDASLTASLAAITSAWTAWVPTVTAGSGTFTALGTVTARYKQVGKTVHFYIAIPITTNGTAAGFVQATLPVASANTSRQSAPGRENTLTGKTLSARIEVNSSLMQITLYDGLYPGASGASMDVSGTYEAA